MAGDAETRIVRDAWTRTAGKYEISYREWRHDDHATAIVIARDPGVAPVNQPNLFKGSEAACRNFIATKCAEVAVDELNRYLCTPDW